MIGIWLRCPLQLGWPDLRLCRLLFPLSFLKCDRQRVGVIGGCADGAGGGGAHVMCVCVLLLHLTPTPKSATCNVLQSAHGHTCRHLVPVSRRRRLRLYRRSFGLIEKKRKSVVFKMQFHTCSFIFVMLWNNFRCNINFVKIFLFYEIWRWMVLWKRPKHSNYVPCQNDVVLRPYIFFHLRRGRGSQINN